jgi:AcrR family transcriptional regulator
MSDVTDHIETQGEISAETSVRERILTTAERLFREIGYHKTTVADIARELRMSPANVYRFFDSKKSINVGVARRLMSEVEQASAKIASGQAGKASATQRLRALLANMHRMNSDRYVADAKMHDMVAVAMEENWEVCQQHGECIGGIIAAIVADGAASGEFRVADVATAALCVGTAFIRFCHPMLIAQCADKPGPTLDQMIDFIIAGLKA